MGHTASAREGRKQEVESENAVTGEMKNYLHKDTPPPDPRQQSEAIRGQAKKE